MDSYLGAIHSRIDSINKWRSRKITELNTRLGRIIKSIIKAWNEKEAKSNSTGNIIIDGFAMHFVGIASMPLCSYYSSHHLHSIEPKFIISQFIFYVSRPAIDKKNIFC
jgi:hypothetical protein